MRPPGPISSGRAEGDILVPEVARPGRSGRRSIRRPLRRPAARAMLPRARRDRTELSFPVLPPELLAVLAHEIRTPLTSILGGADLLDDPERTLSATIRHEVLEHVHAEADRLHRLVEDFLALSAPPTEAGMSEPIAMGPLIRQVVSDITPRMGRRRVRASIAPELPPASGDPDRVARGLRNLVESALAASDDRGVVEVVAQARHGGVAVRVIDHAATRLPSARAGRMAPFAPFSDATWRTPAPGGGLGLAATRALIEAGGGRLWARPRHPVGNELGFELPAHDIPDQSEETA